MYVKVTSIRIGNDPVTLTVGNYMSECLLLIVVAKSSRNNVGLIKQVDTAAKYIYPFHTADSPLVLPTLTSMLFRTPFCTSNGTSLSFSIGMGCSELK